MDFKISPVMAGAMIALMSCALISFLAEEAFDWYTFVGAAAALYVGSFLLHNAPWPHQP